MNRSNKEVMLEVYAQHSPSHRRIDDKYLRLRKTLFHDKLKLPTQLFKNKKVLEFGSGAGIASMPLAQWGAQIECVEILENACDNIRSNYDEWSLSSMLINVNCCDFESFASTEQYDFCIAEGCLHLADDPEGAFHNLVSHLKIDGFVIIAVPEPIGHFQEFLKRYMLYKISDDQRDIVDNAVLIFSDALERANKAGGRDILNIVYDKYVNQNARSISASSVLKWFRKNNIKYYSSTPNLISFKLNDTHYRDNIDLTEEPNIKLIRLSQWYLAKTKDYDSDRVLKKVESLNDLDDTTSIIEDTISNLMLNCIDTIDLEKIQSAFERIRSLPFNEIFDQDNNSSAFFRKFCVECIDFIEFIKGDIEFEQCLEQYNKTEILFRGFTGNPSQYYVGYKS